MRFKIGKKALSMADLPGVLMLLVLIGVTLGVGIYTNTEFVKTLGVAGDSDVALMVNNSTSGLSNLAQWLPIVAIVIAAGIVIGTLILAFSSREGV